MPNYVANRIQIIGSDEMVQKVVEFVKSDYRVFDFEKIVPMPETFKKYDTTNHKNGEQLRVGEHIGYDESSPIVTEELIEEYKRATREQYEQYGVVGWYDWHCKYWGTKWNACEPAYCGDGLFVFDTAWSAPLPVLRALSEIFPEVEIAFAFADEDSSYNTGEGTISKGEIEGNFPDGNSEDGWRLYFELHEWARDEYHKDENGQWVCNED